VPLPTDRADLLRLATETEAAIQQTANASDPKLAQKHARELARLGRIRQRLGETREAERLLSEAVDANFKLGTTLGAELAAVSTVGLASIAVKDGRYTEARGHIDRMIELNGGFPVFARIKGGPAPALALWLTVLEKLEDWGALYEASGTALELLGAAELPEQREAHGHALALRAMSAAELGHTIEAANVYEEAITQLEAKEPSAVRDRYLNQAMMRLPGLYSDLGRVEEGSEAIKRLERLQGKHPLLKGTRVAARAWKRWVD
jgi:tetratricopeptide (TPR) repeat protein